MSFSLHSSTVNFGGGRRSSSSGSNSNSSWRASEKSLIGEMSRKVSANPSLRNHSKLSRCTAMRSGSSNGSPRLANEYRSRETEREATATPSRRTGGGNADGLRQALGRATSQAQRSAGERHARQPAIIVAESAERQPPWAAARAGVRGRTGYGRSPGKVKDVAGGSDPREPPNRRATTRSAWPRVVRMPAGQSPAGSCCGGSLLALLDLDGGAGLFELGLGGLGGLLVGLLQHRLGGGVDEVLGLLQAQAGQLTHDLDDLDLLRAGGGEDDVELVLLLLDRGGCATGGGAGSSDGHGGGRGDAELLLERVEQLLELDHGQAGNGIK